MTVEGVAPRGMTVQVQVQRSGYKRCVGARAKLPSLSRSFFLSHTLHTNICQVQRDGMEERVRRYASKWRGGRGTRIQRLYLLDTY